MNPKQLRLALLGLVALAVIVFIATISLGLSKLSHKSQNMVGLKLQSKVLDDKLTSLAQAKKQVQTYSYIKNVAAEVIPNDKDQAQAVLEISQIAAQTGISIASISFPASTLGITTTTSSSLLSQAKPVLDIKGLYSVQLSITPETGPQVPDGLQLNYAKMLNFLSAIEHNERTAQVTEVTVQPQSSGNSGSASSFTFSLTLNIFIKP